MRVEICKMKDEIIVREITFKCNYEFGDCKYKNPLNYKLCIGCFYSTVLENKLKEGRPFKK